MWECYLSPPQWRVSGFVELDYIEVGEDTVVDTNEEYEEGEEAQPKWLNKIKEEDSGVGGTQIHLP